MTDQIPDEPTAEETAEPRDESLEAAVERLEAEISEWRDHALRATAEAENVKRRAEREANDARAYAIQRFARDLLGVADNLGRATSAAPREHADPAVRNFALGVEMTEKELLQAFERNGLKRIEPARGDRFDPNVHQAMMEQEDAEAPPGSVLQVLQTGYELFGRVVRPAMVAVAAKAKPAGGGAYPASEPDSTGGSVDTRA